MIDVGQVKEIESEEELDDILKADARPLVLLAGFTWCRPCKVRRGCGPLRVWRVPSCWMWKANA